MKTFVQLFGSRVGHWWWSKLGDEGSGVQHVEAEVCTYIHPGCCTPAGSAKGNPGKYKDRRCTDLAMRVSLGSGLKIASINPSQNFTNQFEDDRGSTSEEQTQN